MGKLRANSEIISDKSKNPVTTSTYIKHGNQWLDDAVNNAIGAAASKADKTYVDSELTKKANKSDTDAALSSKADKSALEATNASVSANTSNIQGLSTESTVLSARMDTFTKLSEGSTTGDAELADGRVGADGKTYDNIGGAIRGQVTDLKSDLVKNTNNYRITKWSVKGKYIKTDVGIGNIVDLNEQTYGNALNYVVLNCSEGDIFVINGRGDGEARLYCFVDVDNKCLSVSQNNFVANNLIISAPQNASKLIINDKTSSDSYVGNFLVDRVKDLEMFTEKVPSHFSTSINTGKLSDLRKVGWYTLTARLSDFPSDFSGSNGFLIVYTESLSGFIYQELHSATQIYHRIINNDGINVFNWEKVGNVFNSDLSVFPKRVQSASVYSGNASDLRTLGWYGVNKLGDFPSDFNGDNGVLFVYTDTINHLVYQELHDTTQIWHRIITNEGTAISSWNRIDTTYNKLTNKKWVVCGDSYSHGDFTSGDIPLITDGKYKGMNAVYSYLIGNRNNMNIDFSFARNGSTLAQNDGSQFALALNYESIPFDADIITLYYGINDKGRNIPVGTIDSTDTTTFYGAYNTIISYLISNRPNARIGIIGTNATTQEYVDASKNIALKYGIPFLDMNDYSSHAYCVNSIAPDMDSNVKAIRDEQLQVGNGNIHPNGKMHEIESWFIEEWIKTL